MTLVESLSDGGGRSGAPFAAPGRAGGRRRESRRPTVFLAVLLMVAGAAGAVWLSSARDGRVEAMVLTRAVQRGDVIRSSDLAVARVAVDGARVRLASPELASGHVVGRPVLVDLPAGSLVTPELVGGVDLPAGHASVGLRLGLDALPSARPRPGEWVRVVAADRSGAGEPVAIGGPVVVSGVHSLGENATGGAVVVYLSAPSATAAQIAAAAASPGGVRLLGVRS